MKQQDIKQTAGFKLISIGLDTAEVAEQVRIDMSENKNKLISYNELLRRLSKGYIKRRNIK